MSAPEQWAFFFRYLTDKSKRRKLNELAAQEEGIAMAGQVLMSISKDEVERARLMSEYKYVVDTQSKVVQAKREGRQEGLQQGLQKGLQKGLQQGRQEKEREIARSMKANNMPLDQISAYTGLSVQQIQDL
jgi:predicted transposase/invertase (TIGR01784 family)